MHNENEWVRHPLKKLKKKKTKQSSGSVMDPPREIG